MSEFGNKFELKIERQISREEAMSAYKKFIDHGITTPDVLDLNDPKVKEADELFYKWQEQEDEKVKGNLELELRNELSKSMFYIDAGFTDKNYLDEVLKDWLVQDYIPKDSNNPERAKTRKLYAEAKEKIRRLLREKK